MNADTNSLVLAVLSYLGEAGSSVSKTKLLKLLYLFDVEFYRAHQRSFTGFNWKFFHLGPWTAEYDSVLGDLKKARVLEEVPFSANDFDGVTLRSSKPTPLRSVLTNVSDESILIRILNDWGAEPTGRLLDYVYFHTEPMEQGVRNANLDFSTIAPRVSARYKRSSSSATAKDIEKRKSEYRARIVGRRAQSEPKKHITPPRYDAEYVDALEVMERLQYS